MHPYWYDNIDHSKPYITGNGLASFCRHIFNYGGYVVNENVPENGLVFCKTDFIFELFNIEHLPSRFVLITHNSDIAIDARFLEVLNTERLITWHAANVAIEHPKLRSVPLGIANAGYEHGNVETLRKIQEESNEKDKDIYVNFSTVTNRAVREYCLNCIRMPIVDADATAYDYIGGYRQPRSYESYLRDLSQHKFCASPQGNGIDCLRTWEAIYLKTVPIVAGFKWQNDLKLPIINLNDWNNYRDIQLSKYLYDDVWADFDIKSLDINNFFNNHIGGYIKTRLALCEYDRVAREK